ncbi:MAG: hypothetical protein K2K96_00955 [Lachnospiraceae bacterium]|nr:hypothetical protein [Lachnospiraceae bacterium]
MLGKNLNYHFKSLFSHYGLLAVIAAGYSFLIGMILFKYYFLMDEGVVDAYIFKLYAAPYSYIYFVLIGIISLIYFSMEQDVFMQEALALELNNVQMRMKYLVLMLLNGITYVIVSLITVLPYLFCKTVGPLHLSFVLSMLYQNFADYFLVGIFAIFSGHLGSIFTLRRYRIYFFVVMQFLFGYPFLWISQSFVLSVTRNPIIKFILNATALLPDGFQAGTDNYAIYPTQPHRIALIICWCFLLLFLTQLMATKPVFKRWVTYTSCICFAVFLFFCALPYCQASSGERTIDRFAKMYRQMDDRGNGREIAEAEFCVTSYDITIDAFFNLYAVVRAELGCEQLEEYTFTLYDGYHILHIKDQNGRVLRYEREGHYLTVYSDGSPLSEIIFTYYGAGDPFYCDASAIFLPSGVPFYPMPGKVSLYEDSEFYDMTYYSNNRLPDTYYKVTIHTIGEVFCSLSQTGYHQYAGVADGFFVLKGMYDMVQYDETTFIYPYAVSHGLDVLDETKVQLYLDGITAILSEKGYSSLPGYIFIGWMYGKSRPLDIYANDMVIDRLYYDERIKEDIEYYLQLEEE